MLMPRGNANKIPSILSNIPPWPGSKFPVSFIFAFLFKNEIKRSPSCDVKDIITVKITKFKVKKLLR